MKHLQLSGTFTLQVDNFHNLYLDSYVLHWPSNDFHKTSETQTISLSVKVQCKFKEIVMVNFL